MPAPVPIQFRYDDFGALAAAASAVGQLQGVQQQRARDDAFLQQEFAQRDRHRQSLMAYDAERAAARDRNILEQLKQQQASRLRGTPTMPVRRSAPNLVAPATPDAPAQTVTPYAPQPGGTGTVSGYDTEFTIGPDGQVTGTQDGEFFTLEEIGRRGGFTGEYQPPVPAATDTQVLKTKFVQDMVQTGMMTAEEAAAAQAIISDPDSDVNDLRIATNTIIDNRLQAERLERSDRSFAYRQRRDRARILRQALEEFGTDFEQGPEQFDSVPGMLWGESQAANPTAKAMYEELLQLEAMTPTEEAPPTDPVRDAAGWGIRKID